MTSTSFPRGARRDLTEALRLINGVRTGYELHPDVQRALLNVAVALRDASMKAEAIAMLAPGRTAADPEPELPLLTESELADIRAHHQRPEG